MTDPRARPPRPSAGEPALTIGNIFGHGFGATEVARMEGFGFSIRPEVSHYAGAQALRFIDFDRGPPLELIEVTDAREYAAFVPEGMTAYSPGISLLLPQDSGKRLAEYEAEFAGFHPYRLHVNYDGSQDHGKPGWTYVNFAIPVAPRTFVWLTHLDEPRPPRPRSAPHANGVQRILGLVFDLEAGELETLSRLAGARPREGGTDIDGVAIWSRASLEDVPPSRGKDFPLSAIVLGTPEIGQVEGRAKGAERTTFRSRPAIHLATNPRSWDLIVVSG